MNIIEVKNLGKKYNLGERQGYIALRDVLSYVLRSPFKWAGGKVKEAVGLDNPKEFWALKDLNFSVAQGEVLGIIGRNGAGKSTLLKILSQITPPTTGEARLRGRVGSLLEVGTGFHPELTGRENIYLNGAILGMRKKEIEKKFDEIVEFSGVEKFLDTPVKRYSSGMYVRLAFAVAAHLEPEILLVDEVLAVGDAEFQKKCLGKMEDVTKKEGRTVLFVSHNLGAVRNLCKNTILLESGGIKFQGETDKAIEIYLKEQGNYLRVDQRQDRSGTQKIKITDIFLKDRNGKDANFLICGEDVQIWFKYEVTDPTLKGFDFSIAIDSAFSQNRLALLTTKIFGTAIEPGQKENLIKIYIKKLPLNIGTYQLTFFAETKGEILDWLKQAATFDVGWGNFYGSKSDQLPAQGNIVLDYEFIV